MSYTLIIGKATLNTDHGEYGCGTWRVDECEGPAPHTDEWEASPHEGSPVRLPGYGQWHEVMQQLPAFRKLWLRLERWSRENRSYVIPVTEYVRELTAIETEAYFASREYASRAYWFCRWSRQALKLYGEAACFETPSEWIDWLPDCGGDCEVV